MENLQRNINQVGSDFRAIKEKIEANGVSMSNVQRTADYAQKIDDVYDIGYNKGEEDGYNTGYGIGEGHGYDRGYDEGYADGVAGSTVTFERDDNTAYIKTVPSNAEQKAMLLSVGGMTKKCKNLFDDVSFFATNGWEKQSNGYYLTSQKNAIIFTNTNKISGSMCISYSGKVITSEKEGACLTFLITYTDETTEYIGSLPNINTSYFEIVGNTNASKTVNTITWIYGVKYTAEIKDVMLNAGTTALPYEPYYEGLRNSKVTEIVNMDASGNEIARRTIPEEVQSLEGYGEGLAKGANTLDFADGKYIKRCNTVILTGAEKYTYSEIYHCIITNLFLTDKGVKDALISDAPMSCIYSNAKLNDFQFGGKTDPIENYGITSVDDWKAYLASNPITVKYALAEPIEIDISAYLADFDNILEVERGGTLEFVNEHKHPVPSSILYTKKVGA